VNDLLYARMPAACLVCGNDAEQDRELCSGCREQDRALREAFEWAATYDTSDGAERLRQWALEVYS